MLFHCSSMRPRPRPPAAATTTRAIPVSSARRGQRRASRAGWRHLLLLGPQPVEACPAAGGPGTSKAARFFGREEPVRQAPPVQAWPEPLQIDPDLASSSQGVENAVL